MGGATSKNHEPFRRQRCRGKRAATHTQGICKHRPRVRVCVVDVDNTDITVDEKTGRIEMLEGVTVGDVVGALNRMGVTPRDLIVILQAMQAAGGLQAEIETL